MVLRVAKKYWIFDCNCSTQSLIMPYKVINCVFRESAAIRFFNVGGWRAEANKRFISFASSLKRSDPPTCNERWKSKTNERIHWTIAKYDRGEYNTTGGGGLYHWS